MSISSVLAATKTVVALTTNFASSGTNRNVTIGDFKVLDKGVDRAVVIEYLPSEHGPGTSPIVTHNTYASIHNVVIRVYRRYREDGTTYENLVVDVDAIIAKFNEYPKLALGRTSTVIRAVVERTGDVFALFDSNGEGPYFIRIDVFLEATESVSRTPVE